MITSERQAERPLVPFRLPEETLGAWDAETAARVTAASSDVALVIDRDGFVLDVSVSTEGLSPEELAGLLKRRWIDTVALDSRPKVAEMLADGRSGVTGRWREINQLLANGAVPLRCTVVATGSEGRVIALGRDMRPVEALQQHLLHAQQAMERDYARLRQAESRYRVLFQIASEAVLIVDPLARRIVEANPAAGALLGVAHESLAGKPLARVLQAESGDGGLGVLLDRSTSTRSGPVAVRLADGRDGFVAAASLFNQDGVANVLISLSAQKVPSAADSGEAQRRLLRVLNRVPDAFVVTDDSFAILDANLAFLELTQLPSADAARGQSLGRFLGKTASDMRLMADLLREHGSIRNLGTLARTQYGDQEEVELSAVSARDGLEATHGFVIRRVRRMTLAPATATRELPRTAEQLTQLVGRVSLREIVAETTDVIERMCIEAALHRSGNNRVSAAEILGLSRQSLYSKLNRYGIANSSGDRGDD
ncbi:transcriptional regulator PpsR [Zavarzinia sp. CC-PAN008]|uniref:transcriptional regulator PpsR n=1 Tax=Zavarzinia sp. CC-PAN008 TaxID=3243332 RepID=UPI003F749DE7